MPSDVSLTPKFTAGEVAAQLRVSKRTLRRYLQRCENIHAIRAGRDLLFTKADVQALEEARRKCPLNLSVPDIERTTRSSSSGARSTDESLRSLRRRETKRLLGSSKTNSKPSS